MMGRCCFRLRRRRLALVRRENLCYVCIGLYKRTQHSLRAKNTQVQHNNLSVHTMFNADYITFNSTLSVSLLAII